MTLCAGSEPIGKPCAATIANCVSLHSPKSFTRSGTVPRVLDDSPNRVESSSLTGLLPSAKQKNSGCAVAWLWKCYSEGHGGMAPWFLAVLAVRCDTELTFLHSKALAPQNNACTAKGTLASETTHDCGDIYHLPLRPLQLRALVQAGRLRHLGRSGQSSAGQPNSIIQRILPR